MNDEGTKMLRFITSVFFYFFIVFQTTSMGEEGEPEQLMVPEIQEMSSDKEVTDMGSEEVLTEVPMQQEPLASNDIVEPIVGNEYNDVKNIAEPVTNNEQENIEQNHPQDPTQQSENTEQIQEDILVQQEDTHDVLKESEVPTEEELEVQRAEESELREVGAGEEPSIE